MTNNNSYGDDFDYDSTMRRIAAAGAEKERAEKEQFIREYIAHCARRFRETKAVSSTNITTNTIKSITIFVKNEKIYITLASLVVVSFVMWIENALYVQYEAQNERAFALKCSKNNFRHSTDLICYDEHGYVHTLNPDGTTRKGGLDWNVWRQTDFADRVANPDKAD